MKPTKEQKLKRDKAIRIIWETQKAEWTMKDLAFIFSLHIDTIFQILRGGENKEKIAKGREYLNKLKRKLKLK